MAKISSFLKSPFFLFLFFGAVLYFGYSTTTNYIKRQDKTIRIDSMQFEIEKELYTKTWNRPPSQEQLQRQIDNYIMDEIFYREAVALGLDKSDIAIKRRLRQMLELMLEDYSSITPNENQLRSYLSENEEKFITEDKISFEQLYFAQDEKAKAVQLLERLKLNPDLKNIETRRLSFVPEKFVNETSLSLRKHLGSKFTETIMEVDSKDWFGPVESPFGYHLVRIHDKTLGTVPQLNDIWAEVEEKWIIDRKAELKEEHYRKLREQYTIVFESNEDK